VKGVRKLGDQTQISQVVRHASLEAKTGRVGRLHENPVFQSSANEDLGKTESADRPGKRALRYNDPRLPHLGGNCQKFIDLDPISHAVAFRVGAEFRETVWIVVLG
jgi:hypothetical protein